jgi:hypothetical protein
MNKKGDILVLTSFVSVLLVIIIMALTISMFGVTKGPSFFFSVSDETRYQSCDNNLLAILNSEVPLKSYDFAEAIAMNKPIESDANKILTELYTGEHIPNFVVKDNCCIVGEVCCSQYVPRLDGTAQEVCIVGNK